MGVTGVTAATGAMAPMAVTDPTAATGRTDLGENQPGATAHLGANGGVAMTLAHPQRKILAAQIRAFGTTTPARARRHRSALASMAPLAVLGLLAAASPA